jgi:hypothetical protein
MANKISVLIDVAVDGANRSLKSFKQSIQDADGAAGKFKAGASGAMDSVKANAGNLAMAGGAALFAFGAKAVAAFQDTALEAGRMSEALGMPVDAMSRLIEISGDLGIESGTLEKSLGKMNQTAGRSPKAFDEIGAAIARNQDGSMNVNQTFLNTVDALNRIPDAGRRAAAAQQIFGKGWRDMAQLIGQGSDTIMESMAGVSEAQAISPEEVEKARAFKAAMEDLQDSIQSVVMTVGGALVPALTMAANAANDAQNVAGEADDAFGGLDEALIGVAKANWKYLNPMGQVITALDWMTGETEEATKSSNWLSDALDGVTDMARKAAGAEEERTAGIRRSWEELGKLRDAQEAANMAVLEGIDSSLAYRNQQARTAETIAASAANTDDMAQAARDAEGAVLDQAAAAVKLAEDQAAASGATFNAEQKAATYKAELEKLAGFLTGDARIAVQMYIDQLNRIPRTIDTRANFVGGGGSLAPGGRRASGGPVSAGGAYLVGEQGPEILQMGGSGGNIVPNHKLGGDTYNFTINEATNPDAVVRAIRQHVKNNGPIQGIT